jgi:hypothetical protein
LETPELEMTDDNEDFAEARRLMKEAKRVMTREQMSLVQWIDERWVPPDDIHEVYAAFLARRGRSGEGSTP